MIANLGNLNKNERSDHYDRFDHAFLYDKRASYLNLASERLKSTNDYKNFGPKTRICNLHMLSDTFLWDRVMKMQHVMQNHHFAVQEIFSIFTQHVQGAQLIYQSTIFRDHSVSCFFYLSLSLDLILFYILLFIRIWFY